MWKNIAIPTILVTACWIISSLTTTYYIHWIGESESRMLQENFSTLRDAGAMRYTLRKLQTAVLAYKPENAQSAWVNIEDLESTFESHLSSARTTSLTKEEQDLVEMITQAFAEYCDAIEQRLSGAAAPNSSRNLLALSDAVADLCKRLGDINARLMHAATAERGQAAKTINQMRLIMLIIGPVVGLLSGVWMSRRFQRSISEIQITLNDATTDQQQSVARVALRSAEKPGNVQNHLESITQRVRSVVSELHETRRKVQSAARLAALGELAASVAHELRNPLTSVKLLVQTAALRSGATGMNGRQLQIVQEEIARMEISIERLLDYARPAPLHRVRHDLRETLRRAINLVDGRAAHQNIRLMTLIPEHPLEIDADPEQLRQVFLNLLLNAMDATERGGVVRLTTDCTDETCYRISVEDSGPGIPGSIIDRIFEPFVTTKPRGTGLGLTISQRIILEHHGQLLAANRSEGGAVFTVELPRVDSPRRELSLTTESPHA